MIENFKHAEVLEDNIENDFYRKAEQLPKELAEKWIQEYEGLEDPENSDFFERFNSFLNLRKLALIESVEIESEIDERIIDEISSVQDVINGTFGDTNYFINNGSTAEVYELPIAPHLCVKYISDQEKYNEHNHLRAEYNFLRDLRSLQVNGVRTPIPYFIQIHPSLGHSYGMERILGKSLSQILEKPSENVGLINIIKKIDKETVVKDMTLYIQKMHEKFHITHNDLELRNIMVDENGQFFIIDFGKAKHEEIGEDHEVFRNSDLTKINIKIGDFFKQIDNINIDDIMKGDI